MNSTSQLERGFASAVKVVKAYKALGAQKNPVDKWQSRKSKTKVKSCFAERGGGLVSG
jgi:hypothetical protein